MVGDNTSVDVKLSGATNHTRVVIEHDETEERIGSFGGGNIAIPDVDDAVVAARLETTGVEPDNTTTSVEESSEMYRVVDRSFTLANVDVDTDQHEGEHVESQVHIFVLSQDEYEEQFPE